MAVELVVGALLSSSLQFLFERFGSGEVLAYLRGKSKKHDLEQLVEKLKEVLSTVIAVIEDAEQKQRKSKRVEVWLDRLQEAVFDAEDLLDVIETEAMKLKEKAESSIGTSKKRSVVKKKIRNIFSPSSSSDNGDMASKVKELLDRFKDIASEAESLGLEKSINPDKASWRLPSSSLVDLSTVCGREDDKNKMVKLLLSDDLSNEKACVISIVGMGGVGKTTLAQTIYNDSKVKEHFEIKAWVCVSEEFDVCRATEAILKEVGVTCSDCKELNSFQVKLKESLDRKKFLIVLDDVWTEKPAELDILCLPFKDGARGSKIIVTTRNEKVATRMCAVQIHHVQKLSEDESWTLFSKAACGVNGDFITNSELEGIGRGIVKKCDGLPLALKTLGGLLCSSLEAGEWRRILESDIWDLGEDESNILPALTLSYHYLPSQFKRCFAFCSIFPTDYEFEKDELILLWMAENLLESPKGSMRIEDVGEKCFNGLVSRSFFQRSSTTECGFVMHDLIHDLAKFVSGAYCFYLEEATSNVMNVNKARHLGYVATHADYYKRFRHVLQATKLRTFLPHRIVYGYMYNAISSKAVSDFVLKFPRLRVLSLCQYSNVDHLPDSIGDLRHLRYIDVSETEISSLPESICNLLNLQTLKLRSCERLKNLPKDMHHLIKLRHLDLRNCNRLVEMPRQLSKLKNLQMLSTFIVGKDDGTKIGELRELSHLRGELCIQKLENVGNVKSPLDQGNLINKHLHSLKLEWSDDVIDNADNARDVLDMLVPNVGTLKELCISRYSGIKFPNWVGINSLDNIVSLKLSRCTNCTSLPPLGQLPSLKILFISDFYELVDVGQEFYGDGAGVNKPFQSLEILKLSSMSSWERWFQADSGAFSQLIELKINKCSELTGDLPGFLPSLKKLQISGCEKLASALPRFLCAHELNFEGCTNMIQVESFIESLKQMDSCECIQFSDCSSTVPTPILTGCLPSSLKKLVIEKCKGLEIEFDCPHRSLEVLKLTSTCDALKSLPIDCFPKLKELEIENLESLESLSMSDGLHSQNLTSLTSMVIKKCVSFVSFPKGGLAAPNLTRLEISECNKLRSLPEKMNILLTSLDKLKMKYCPEIESLPKDSLPSSLTELNISYCDKLIAARKHWGLKRLPNLRVVKIKGSNEDVESFPEDGLLPITITDLEISGFPNMKSLDKDGLPELTSLEELEVSRLPKLQRIPGEALSLSVKSLYIAKCDEVRSVSEEDLPTSLKRLFIWECRNCRIILEKGLPASLECLDISSCNELQIILEKGLPSSLQTLLIYHCLKLKTMSPKHFPNSLQYLHIWRCPLLAKKCEPEKGEYWKNIAHVPCIQIDDYRILG